MSNRTYQHETFPPATDAEIAAFEKRIGVTFCDDFKAFLRADNGLELKSSFDYEDTKEWVYQLYRYFGIHPDQKYGMEGELDGFFDRRYLPICYPVGVDGSGNLMVQIAAGSRRGHIAMLDHEVWNGGMRAILDVTGGFYPDDDEEEHPLPFQTWADATPDQVLDECFKHGFLAHYPVTFAEHLAAADQLFNRLSAEYRTRPKPKVAPKAELQDAYILLPINGTWTAVEKLSSFQGDVFTFESDEVIGWHYGVTMEDTRDIRKIARITGPGGELLMESDGPIETNGTYRAMASLNKSREITAQSGTYSIEIRFPEDPALPVLRDTREIIVGERPLGFTSAAFRPAVEEDVAALETKAGYRFCDDFRAWLQETNGIQFQWPWIALWSNVLEDAPFDAYEAEVKSDARAWELQVYEITGLHPPGKVWSAYIDPPAYVIFEQGLNEALKDVAGTPRLTYLYPVAKSHRTGLQVYFQVAQGAHRGKIAELAAYDFQLDQIANVQDFKRVEGRGKKAKTLTYPFKSLAEATPDQVIEAWVKEGMIRITDMTFADFAKRVITAHEAEFSRLYDKYIVPKAS